MIVSGWATSLVRHAHRIRLVRQAVDDEARADLVRAARVISTVHHPGIERFVDLLEDPTSTTLITDFVGERSLAHRPPTTPTAATRLAHDLCTLVHRMHELGVCHGPLSVHQVLYTPSGDPVLCGFTEGDRLVDTGPLLWTTRITEDRRHLADLLDEVVRDTRIRSLFHPASWIEWRRFDHAVHELRAGRDPWAHRAPRVMNDR